MTTNDAAVSTIWECAAEWLAHGLRPELVRREAEWNFQQLSELHRASADPPEDVERAVQGGER